MDFLIYMSVLGLIGFVRMNKTKDVTESIGIVSTGATVTVDCDLPYASNLALVKEPGAFTLILEDLGLI